MAKLYQALDESEVKKLTLAKLKSAYSNLAEDYTKMIDRQVLLCPSCGEWMKADTAFYFNKKYVTNRYPICKRCLMKIAEQREKDTDEPNETKESVQKVLQMMDLVYDDGFYEDCVKGALDCAKEKNRSSPLATYLTSILSLPQWKGKTWKDSDFGDMGNSIDEEEVRIIQKTVKNGKKIFGNGYSNEDYMFLMNQYEDWQARTQVDSKSQETYITQICLQLLDIDKDRKAGKDASNKLKALDTLMNAANLQPKQNVNNAANDTLSFGQMIEKFENERPISDPDPEFADVNNIGKLIRTYFAGHLVKALGLSNAYSKEYEEELAKYTVQPVEMQEDVTSNMYNDIFGSDDN